MPRVSVSPDLYSTGYHAQPKPALWWKEQLFNEGPRLITNAPRMPRVPVSPDLHSSGLPTCTAEARPLVERAAAAVLVLSWVMIVLAWAAKAPAPFVRFMSSP